MKNANFIVAGCLLSILSCPAPAPSHSSTSNGSGQTTANAATPLILEKDEGERRIFRPWPGHPQAGPDFILKIDPQNGGSAHLVLGTESLAPGDKIEPHRHPSADEVLLLQSGVARVQMGDTAREVHAGATVFIPANTWISVVNTGKEAVALVFIFSAPGFEQYMRAESVRPGEKIIPVSEAEDREIEKRHAHDVFYKHP
jgi:quercetin dioxygenase-like cupin family protein